MLAPGAVGSDSGSAGVIVRSMAFGCLLFQRTIHFAVFGGEEQGMSLQFLLNIDT